MSAMQEQPVDLTLLSAYLDGEVTTEERALVEAQLRLSPAWREELEGLRWTVSLLRELPEAPLPRSFELPVPAATARAATRTVSRQAVWGLDLGWLYGFLRASAVVTVALLMAVAGLDVFQTQRDLSGVMAERRLSDRAPEAALSQPAQGLPAEAPRAAAPAAPTTAPAGKALQNPGSQPTFPAAAAPPRPGSGGAGGGGGGAGGLGGGEGAGAGGSTSGAQDGVAIVGTPAAAAGAVQSSATPDTEPLASKAQRQAQPQAQPPAETQPHPLAAQPLASATPAEPTAWWRWLETGLTGLTVALALGAWAVRRRLKAGD